MPAEPRRAILLRHSDADGQNIERLIHQHSLAVVYTIATDTAVPRLAVMMAAQYVAENRAEVVIIPHLTRKDIWASREWRALAELVDVVIADGTVIDAEFAQP